MDRASQAHRTFTTHRTRKVTTSLLVSLSVVLTMNLFVYLNPAKAVNGPSFNEQVLINMTNRERKANGLGELTYNHKLAAAARAKAEDMFAKQYFEHVSPSGKTPWVFIKSTGYSYVKAGENLAIDYPTVTGPIPAWMASPTHRANMLKPDYKEIGIVEVIGTFQGKETRIVVQMFGTPQRLFSTYR